MALGLLVIAAVAATGWWLAAARPREVPVAGSLGTGPAVSGSAVSSVPAGQSSPTGVSAGVSAGVQPSSTAGYPRGTSPPSTAPPIVVDVAGKVRHPGIYRLPPGARVYDALRAAGGAKAGVSTLSINLAAPLHDGEQVVVGAPGAAAGGGAGDGGAAGGASSAIGSAGASAAPVDLNTATLEQLETLPGVGPVLGQHILDWRDAHGHFATIDQLREVSGIGDVRFAQLRPLVTL